MKFADTECVISNDKIVCISISDKEKILQPYLHSDRRTVWERNKLPTYVHSNQEGITQRYSYKCIYLHGQWKV